MADSRAEEARGESSTIPHGRGTDMPKALDEIELPFTFAVVGDAHFTRPELYPDLDRVARGTQDRMWRGTSRTWTTPWSR